MNVFLAVAENRAVCETLRTTLPKTDLLIFETSVTEAGRRLVSLQVDAVILDDSPALGAPAIEALKAIAPATPVIALTSHGDLASQAGLTRAGANRILVKPFACEALREAVDAVVVAGNPTIPVITPPVAGYARYASLNQHQMALRWLSRSSAHHDDPLHLARSLVESAADIFDAMRCAVLLEGTGGVRIVASQGIADSIAGPLRLSYNGGLMRWFDEHACLIDRDLAQDAPQAVKELQLLSARLSAPLLCNGRVFGCIVLGEKASGLDYTPEERELLTLIARSTSVSFERAGMHADAASREEHYGAALDYLPAGLVTVGPDKTVTLMNRQAEAILEVRSADVLGCSVQKLGSAFADVVLRTLADGKPRPRQEINDPAVGARLGLSTGLMNGGRVVVVFAKLPEAHVPTEDIAYSPFWEYLSSRVAQEIKNPMVAINTFAQLLPRKYDSEDFREAFSQVVQKEVERINGVVETLFDFARDPKLTLQRCNLNETVRNIMKSFEAELAARSIKLETLWGDEAAEAEIDPVYFSQAVHNVVQNSIEAMSKGGTLTVSTNRRDDLTEIRITDTGAGVQPGDEGLIFLPFFSSRERGMGLGLPTAKRILRQHRGELQMVSNGEKGCCFAIRLPRREKGHEERSNSSEGVR